MSKSFSTIAPGTVIDRRYEVVKALGVGAVATALLVIDRELEGQSLVLKVLHPHLTTEEGVTRRFCREAMLARQLTHPNIVRVYDVVTSQNLTFLTMEYVQGCTLRELLSGSTGNLLPFPEAINIFQQILSGLIAAHERDILHRDLKPENILVDRNGVTKIADFGLAKSVTSSFGLTQTGELVGTPAYMAPEQFGNAGGQASDLYSFAMLAYEVLTGSPPFVSDNPLTLRHLHLQENANWECLTELGTPPWFVEILRLCAAKQVEERPASARAVLSLIASQQIVPSKKVQKSISTAVRHRQKSHHLFSEKVRNFLRVIWAVCVITGAIGIAYDNRPRERIATELVKLQRISGFSVAPYLQLLGFGKYKELGPPQVLQAIADGNLYALRVLLSQGVHFDDQNFAVTPALHKTLESKNYSILHLCEAGAPVEATDTQGDTVLITAAKKGLTQHSIWLMDYCKPSFAARDHDGNNAFMIAVNRGDTTYVQAASNRAKLAILQTQYLRNNFGLSSLHIAIQKADLAILKILISTGFDVNTRDGEGNTALMQLIRLPVTSDTHAMFDMLLEKHCDTAARDNRGRDLRAHWQEGGIQEWDPILREHGL